MDGNLILSERRGRVATLTLNRPEKLNALTPEMLKALAMTVTSLREEPDIRCVILRGAGENAFSTGFDISRIGHDAPQPGENGWSEPIYFYDDLIDPAAFFGDSADCIYYAFSYLTVPENRPAQMWVGSGQELAVWLNGEQVYKYDGTYRNHLLPNDVVEVNVKAGVNRILVKAGQRDGISQFSLNICETETDRNYAGNRLAGAKFLYWVEPERMKGDYNGDDRVDIMDLISLLRVMHERDQDPECDFNADGRIDILDVIGLLLYLKGNK